MMKIWLETELPAICESNWFKVSQTIINEAFEAIVSVHCMMVDIVYQFCLPIPFPIRFFLFLFILHCMNYQSHGLIEVLV